MLARDDALRALASEPFDVLVIGGGITGAGVALDAATRGYSVALVEKADYAAGTSSRSSKLVHGGLRYLQNFDLGLVREALLERQINAALAPHLVRPLPMVVPAFDGARPDRLMGIGLNMYDVMAVDRLRRRRDTDDDSRSPERHRIIPGEEIEVRAAHVVNATGVWADRLRPEELHDEAEVPVIRPSRGTHIVLARETLPLISGAIVPAGGGRTIFALPWLGGTLIGTTDRDYEGPLEHVPPDEEDVDYLLDASNAFFDTALGQEDLTGAYAGVRPLISSGDPHK